MANDARHGLRYTGEALEYPQEVVGAQAGLASQILEAELGTGVSVD